MATKLESKFKSEFLEEVRDMFPGCHIEINGTDFMQGIPDTTIYFGKRWAKLEFKRSKTASKRPNQDYYIEMFDRMSFARFVTPENQEDVLRELYQAFGPRRNARHLRSVELPLDPVQRRQADRRVQSEDGRPTRNRQARVRQ